MLQTGKLAILNAPVNDNHLFCFYIWCFCLNFWGRNCGLCFVRRPNLQSGGVCLLAQSRKLRLWWFVFCSLSLHHHHLRWHLVTKPTGRATVAPSLLEKRTKGHLPFVRRWAWLGHFNFVGVAIRNWNGESSLTALGGRFRIGCVLCRLVGPW